MSGSLCIFSVAFGIEYLSNPSFKKKKRHLLVRSFSSLIKLDRFYTDCWWHQIYSLSFKKDQCWVLFIDVVLCLFFRHPAWKKPLNTTRLTGYLIDWLFDVRRWVGHWAPYTKAIMHHVKVKEGSHNELREPVNSNVKLARNLLQWNKLFWGFL